MWLVSVSVMLAVVQCASRAGGSPRLPTLSTPPRRGVSAARAPAPSRTKATRARTPLETKRPAVIRHLRRAFGSQPTLVPRLRLVKLIRTVGSGDGRQARLLEAGGAGHAALDDGDRHDPGAGLERLALRVGEAERALLEPEQCHVGRGPGRARPGRRRS